jgi:hypothetical protein
VTKPAYSYDELDEIFRGKGDNDTVAWCSVRRSCQPGQSLGPNRAEHAVLIVERACFRATFD